MNPITLSEMSDEDEEVKIISSYEPQDDEIAIVFDSSKLLEVMHWIFSSSPSNHILMLKCTEILMVFRTCN